MKLFFYAYKSWGHDPIWYFSCICRKFSELRALLFLRSTQTSQNLKFIQKWPCLSSLKNKFQWTQKFFWPLIRKVLIWTFWDCKINPHPAHGCNRSPPTMYFQKIQVLGVFRPFLQRSLAYFCQLAFISLLVSFTFWLVLLCLGQLQFSHFFTTFLKLKIWFLMMILMAKQPI